jgi:Hsp70 protein
VRALQVTANAKYEQLSLVSMSVDRYQKLLEDEGEMAASDALQTATDVAKNNLEEYLLGLRAHLSDRYAEYVKPGDKDALVQELTALEDWLYEDGEDEKKSVRSAAVADARHEYNCLCCASAVSVQLTMTHWLALHKEHVASNLPLDL